MRKGIFIEKDGIRYFNLPKIIGSGFGNGWFTNCKCRYRIFCGARNTGKSKRMIGYESIFKILSDERRNIVVCRAEDVNNRQSTFANIMRCINDLDLQDSFKATTQPLEITYLPTGQKIVFRGLSNPTSLTSLEFTNGYLTDIYIEEAYEVKDGESFEMLDGSIRAGSDFDDEGNLVENDIPLQITLLLNPWSENWIYEQFFRGNLEDDYEYLSTHKYADFKDDNYQGAHGKGLYLHKSTYKVNEFRKKNEVDPAAEEMKRKNLDLYKVVFLGMWGSVGQTTYPEFTDSCLADTQTLLQIPCAAYAIGIDAGFGREGKKITVKKNEDPNVRVRSATTMELVGVSRGFDKIYVVDEYYHTNIGSRYEYNSDVKDDLTMPQIVENMIKTIIKWKEMYGQNKNSLLMKGQINVFVDNADVGLLDMLRVKAREFGLFNVLFTPSTKTSVNGRCLFEKLMFSYSDFIYNKDKCHNLIRETRLARGGEKGEIRTDENDHCLTAVEYGYAPFRNSFARWKNNFKDF